MDGDVAGWAIGGAGVMVSDFGRSLGRFRVDLEFFGLTLVTDMPGMSENIWEDVGGRCDCCVLLGLYDDDDAVPERALCVPSALGVMVNWPLPMLTTVDGDVGIIFSAADEMSELMSNMGSFEGEPLVDGEELWENGDAFASGSIADGLELASTADMPVRLVSL